MCYSQAWTFTRRKSPLCVGLLQSQVGMRRNRSLQFNRRDIRVIRRSSHSYQMRLLRSRANVEPKLPCHHPFLVTGRSTVCSCSVEIDAVLSMTLNSAYCWTQDQGSALNSNVICINQCVSTACIATVEGVLTNAQARQGSNLAG